MWKRTLFITQNFPALIVIDKAVFYWTKPAVGFSRKAAPRAVPQLQADLPFAELSRRCGRKTMKRGLNAFFALRFDTSVVSKELLCPKKLCMKERDFSCWIFRTTHFGNHCERERKTTEPLFGLLGLFSRALDTCIRGSMHCALRSRFCMWLLIYLYHKTRQKNHSCFILLFAFCFRNYLEVYWQKTLREPRALVWPWVSNVVPPGDAKTLMFVNVSPDAEHAPESLCSLRPGSRGHQNNWMKAFLTAWSARKRDW